MYLRQRLFNIAKRPQIILILLSLVLLIILTAAPPMATAAPLDDFVIPTRIANPQTAEKEFFNMRLQYFLPETEPLIKATFGNVLRFENSAFWEYASIYSRAVSFATNLPTLAKIEYGLTTNYGMSTEQSESYYYQHLLYLKGLQPGTTYHYRIKVKGSDGQFLVSQNYTFTTLTLTPDIIRIPQDLPDQSMPYKLTTPNARYLLTQDIHAPNGGIVLRANDIVVDLGGHTIVYDNEYNHIVNHTVENAITHLNYNDDASHGIKGGFGSFRNFNIFNGKIVQGANGGQGIWGSGFNPIMLSLGINNEIAGVTADYYGDFLSGIVSYNSCYTHHNVVNDRGTKVDNRGALLSAIYAGDARYPGEGTAYNSVRRSRQCGIRTGSDKFGNEVYGDSFTSNSILVFFTKDGVVSNNKIFGLGYNPQGIANEFVSNGIAENNFVYLHGWSPNQRESEYDRLSVAIGFRPMMYSSEIDRGAPMDNNLFVNNVVVLKAWAYDCHIYGMTLPSDKYSKNMVIKNNIVKAETMYEDIAEFNGGYGITCVDTNSGGDESLPEVIFEDNRFISNVHHIQIGGNRGIGRNLSFYRNTFERINHHDRHFAPVRIGYWNWSTFDNKLIDSITGPGVNLSLPPKVNTYYNDVYLNLDVGVSSERAYVDAATGTPLANRAIAYRLNGGEQGQFITNGKGEAYREWITTKNEFKSGDIPRIMPQVHNSTVTFTVVGYEPLTVNIANIQGTGQPIRFFGYGPTIDPYLVPAGFWGGPHLNANTMMLNLWSYSAFDGVEIYRSSTQNGTFQLIKTENGPPLYYDANLQPNTTYYYKIKLFKGDKYGPLTEAITLKTDDIIVEGLGGGPYLDANTMMLNFWSYSAFDGAEIYRSDSPNGFQLVKTENGTPPYYDRGLKPNTTYYYKARLFQGSSFGSLTDAVALKTGDIIAEDFRGGVNVNNIGMTWWSRSNWDYAEVYRSSTGNDNDFVLYAYVYQTPFTDLKVEPGNTYYYKIRLVKDGHIGPFTSVLRFTMQ